MPETEKLVQLPLVPLRDMVVFPSMMAPFVVGRRASITALEATLSTSEKRIFLATQRDPKVDDLKLVFDERTAGFAVLATPLNVRGLCVDTFEQ